MSKYVAFDLEIFNIIPEGETDWHKHRPLGISCAALYDGAETDLMYNRADKSQPMTPYQCSKLIELMIWYTEQDYQIVSWNGCGFDFDILAEESGMYKECAALALNHIDMMFHFFCVKGFPIGLDAAAKGLGLAGKTEGMDGAKAPEMWRAGEYNKVLDYLEQDVVTTYEVAVEAMKARRVPPKFITPRAGIPWTAKSGRSNFCKITQWLTVAEAMNLAEPNTSWMDAPWPRSKFTGWLNQ